MTTAEVLTLRRACESARAEMERTRSLRDQVGLRDRRLYDYWQARHENAAALYERIVKMRWAADRAYRWRERLGAFRHERSRGRGLADALRQLARLYLAAVPKYGWAG